MEVKELAHEMAVELVEEQLARHPQLQPQRSFLLTKREEEIKHELQEAQNRFSDSIQRALHLLSPNTFPTEFQLLKTLPSFNWLEYGAPITVSEDFLTYLFHEGERWQKEEKYPEALCLFQLQGLLNPSHFLPYLHAGYCHFKMGHLDQARELFDLAVSLSPHEPKCYYFSSLIRMILQQKSEAEAICESGLKEAYKQHNTDWIHQLSLLKELIHKPQGEL